MQQVTEGYKIVTGN